MYWHLSKNLKSPEMPLTHRVIGCIMIETVSPVNERVILSDNVSIVVNVALHSGFRGSFVSQLPNPLCPHIGVILISWILWVENVLIRKDFLGRKNLSSPNPPGYTCLVYTPTPRGGYTPDYAIL